MIRIAEIEDLSSVMSLYDGAREFMRRSGNPNQWINGYPSEEIIRSDIENHNLYVEEIDGKIEGCFALIIGDEPTYKVIDGQWPDKKSYATIHRLVSSGKFSKLSDRCIAFCKKLSGNLRADTHADNLIMQRALLRNGFIYCGIIHVANGTPRFAYSLTK